MNANELFPPLVYTIWWIGLLVTLVVFVPLAVTFLHRTWRAAWSIQIYARDALQAAAGIEQNTRHVSALDTTISVAGEMLDVAGDVDKKLDTVANVLAARAK